MTDLTKIIEEAIRECAGGVPVGDGLHIIATIYPGTWAKVAADAIRAARTVTTVEQLDALPVGTVIRDRCGFIFDKGEAKLDGPVWWHEGEYDDQDDIDLPAHVLCRPDEDGAR